jgi:hypothetical protein
MSKPASVPAIIDHYAEFCLKSDRKGRSKEQKAALGYYQFCLREEDRYSNSIFYRPDDARSKELARKAKDASDWCKALGIEHP